MSNPPPLLRDPRKTDAEHLQLLAIFHFVLGGFAFLGFVGLFSHYQLMNSIFQNPEMWQQGGKPATPPPPEFFQFFKWFYVIAGVCLVAALITNVLSGLWIRARKHRIFSLVIAGLNCLQIPLGTILGVFTIVVLSRDSVRELYDVQKAPR